MRLGRYLKPVCGAIALLYGSAAQAGPLLIAAPYIAAFFTGSVVIQAGVALGVAIIGSSMQRRDKRRQEARQRAEYNSSLQDRLITQVSAELPYRLAYGISKVGSNIVAIFTSGDKDQYKHLICVHANHECESILEVYVAGKALGALDPNGFPTTGDYARSKTVDTVEGFGSGPTATLIHAPITNSVMVYYLSYGPNGDYETIRIPYTIAGNVITPSFVPEVGFLVSYQYIQFESTVRVKKHLGGPTDPVDNQLNFELPALWPATAVLRDHCYTYIRLDLNQAEFQSGIPNIEVLLKGKKLDDPRTGLVTWSQNPALVLFDYMRSPICGIDPSSIAVSYVIAAANDCDSIIPIGGGPYPGYADGYGPRFTFNGTITSDQDQQQMLQSICDSMGGSLTTANWEMFAGVYYAPTMSLTQSDIVGDFSVTPGSMDAQKFNGLKGRYASPETAYITTDYVPYLNYTYAALDGKPLYVDVDYPFTDLAQRIQNLARIQVEDQRNGYTLTAEFSMKAWALKVGQRVSFTSVFFGVTSKVFRVTDKVFQPAGTVKLTLKEDSPTIWDYADSISADDTPNTNLTSPFIVAPIASLSASSGDADLYTLSDGTVITRVHLTWPQSTTQGVINDGLIDIEWQETNTTGWIRAQAAGSETSAYIQEVKDGRIYLFRVRAVNPYVNVKSDWTYCTHQVIGKLAPPPDVDSFTVLEMPGLVRRFFWEISGTAPRDLAGFLIRYSSGTTAQPWEGSVPLFEAGALERSKVISSPGDGTWRFLIRSVDTSGNLSINSKAIVITFDQSVFGFVAATVDVHALGWPGTIVNAGISGTFLIDAGTLTWDTIPDQWDNWLEWDGPSIGNISYQHTTYDIGSIESVVVRMFATTSGALTQEIQYSDDDITYTPFSAIPSTPITLRYIRFKWSVVGSYPIIYTASFNIYLAP